MVSVVLEKDGPVDLCKPHGGWVLYVRNNKKDEKKIILITVGFSYYSSYEEFILKIQFKLEIRIRSFYMK